MTEIANYSNHRNFCRLVHRPSYGRTYPASRDRSCIIIMYHIVKHAIVTRFLHHIEGSRGVLGFASNSWKQESSSSATGPCRFPTIESADHGPGDALPKLIDRSTSGDRFPVAASLSTPLAGASLCWDCAWCALRRHQNAAHPTNASAPMATPNPMPTFAAAESPLADDSSDVEELLEAVDVAGAIAPLETAAAAGLVVDAVCELSCDCWETLKPWVRMLPEPLYSSARR